ncbi:hypothetical protein [Hydrogenophaga sp. RWCD_12]|uniref:hypothetical protein n=1 Tax=Hydrogenophaga sp. RWCD_12 TaxID=3391190 RepID=UPI003984B6FE
MDNQTPELFTASAWGCLPPAAARLQPLSAREPDNLGPGTPLSPPEPTLVESLGFPRDTPPRLLARVLEDIHATAPGHRVDRLYTPGVLSRLFSQSAAQASYAMAILSIVESRHYASTLEQLRSA